MGLGVKRCSCCGLEKAHSDFHKNKSKADGMNEQCKVCRSIGYKKSRDKVLAYQKEYYQENRDHKINYQIAYAKDNKDTVADYQKSYRQNNKEALAEYHKQYWQNNRGVLRASFARRRARQKNAYCEWLDSQYVKDLYSNAREATELFGTCVFHVDHIVPLQGDTVCGLHNQYNLQVLPDWENLKKSNRLIQSYLEDY